MYQTGKQLRTPPLSFRLTSKLISYTPHWTLYHASRTAGFLHFLFSTEKRRSYLDNLSSAAQPGNAFKPWNAFQNHTLNVLELLKAPSESPGDILKRVTIHGRERLDKMLAQKKGLIIVTIHSGNWELSGLALPLSGYPINTIAGEQLKESWSDSVKKWKRSYGIKVLSPKHSMRDLYRDLAEGRLIVLHMDGNLFTGGIILDFLGKPVRLPRGPAHLSRMTGAPIGVAVCRRRNRNRLDILIKTTLSPPESPEAEADTTRKLAAEIENCVLEEPGQWCIFRRM